MQGVNPLNGICILMASIEQILGLWEAFVTGVNVFVCGEADREGDRHLESLLQISQSLHCSPS